MIEAHPTSALPEVIEIRPTRHGDDRGWFSEVWNRAEWEQIGVAVDWCQDNESWSVQRGTVRGIHFQREPLAQDKLIRVLRGRITSVAVDLRRSSVTFGKHAPVELTAASGNQLFVPKGFGHGFVTLDDDCHIGYKVSAPYDATADAALNFADPDLAIDWGIAASEAILSDKDRKAPLVADATELLFA